MKSLPWKNLEYFTNLDFPEIWGPISLPKRYLLGEIGRVRSRPNLTRKMLGNDQRHHLPWFLVGQISLTPRYSDLTQQGPQLLSKCNAFLPRKKKRPTFHYNHQGFRPNKCCCLDWLWKKLMYQKPTPNISFLPFFIVIYHGSWTIASWVGGGVDPKCTKPPGFSKEPKGTPMPRLPPRNTINHWFPLIRPY